MKNNNFVPIKCSKLSNLTRKSKKIGEKFQSNFLASLLKEVVILAILYLTTYLIIYVFVEQLLDNKHWLFHSFPASSSPELASYYHIYLLH